MSFGWAPPEGLRRQKSRGHKENFFNRLGADNKCIFPQRLLLTPWSVRSVQRSNPRKRPRQRDIPTFRDIITQELERLMITPPQLTGNIETFLHGDCTVLFSIREEVQRGLLTAIENAKCGLTTSTPQPQVYHFQLPY